jgi:hypothetical protein
MNLHELSARARAGELDGLDLLCLEGGIYVVEARIGARAYPLLDSDGQPLHLRSLEHAREVLHGLPMALQLDQAEAGEEMCGMHSGDRLRLARAMHG